MKQNSRIELLKKCALFSSLSPDEFHLVQTKITIRNFKKNEVILREEDTNQFMYIVIEGEVKVVQTTEKGKEILITMHRQNDFFGELSLLDGKTAPATIYATNNSVIAIVSKEEFYSLIRSQVKVLDNLLRMLCARLRESLKKIQMLNFNNASQRLKMLFLMLSENYGEKNAKGTVLKVKLIHQDIADMTGLTRETVTRILDKWKQSGEIQILQDKYILLKPEFESITF